MTRRLERTPGLSRYLTTLIGAVEVHHVVDAANGDCLPRAVNPFGLLEFALERLGVGVEFLLDRLFRPRERLVELLSYARLPDHDQRALSVFKQFAELRGVIARHALFQVPSDAAGEAADRCRAEHQRREQDPDERSDRDATPGAVLRSLLVLLNVDLPFVVLPDQGDVVSSHELRRVGFEQKLVVSETIVVARVGRCVDENRSVAHFVSYGGIAGRDGEPRASTVHGESSRRSLAGHPCGSAPEVRASTDS